MIFAPKRWRKAFEKYGLKISFEKIRPQIGKGKNTLLLVFLTKDEIDKFGDGISEKRGEIFEEEFWTASSRFRKFVSFLKNCEPPAQKFLLLLLPKKEKKSKSIKGSPKWKI